MKKSLFLPAAVGLALCMTAFAGEPAMTKIVSRMISDSVPEGSFAAKPKTLYRAGYKYARTEEELDVENRIHALMITSEPDTWMVNLADKTARHIVDPGPTFFMHAPILWIPARNGRPEQDKAFKELEYGNEMEFFQRNNAKPAGLRPIDGRPCKGLSIKKGDREIVLFISSVNGKPYRLDILKDGRTEYSIRYLVYDTNLPFRKSLFEPPPGVKISEAK